MMNTDQLRTTLEQLPLSERVQMLEALESSVTTEYEQLATISLREDIRLVEQRLAELDAGQIESLPWDEVRRRVFGR